MVIRLPDVPGSSPEKYDAYWKALGKFIHEFARIEAALQLLLWRLSKMDPKLAKAVFSGTRIDGASQFIRRLLEVRPIDKKKEAVLLDMLTQLKIINDVRNLIVHHGAKVQEGDLWLVTNKHTAHAARSLQEMQISVKMLNAMTSDLSRIGLNLTLLSTPRQPATLFSRYARLLTGAWLYKPSPRSGQASGKNRRSKNRPVPTQ